MRTPKALILLIVLLTAAVSFSVFTRNQKPPEKAVMISPTSVPLGRKTEIPEFGMSLRLPDSYIIEQNGQFSRLIRKSTANISAGATNFLYISVIPVTLNVPDGEIYNYSQKEFTKMLRSEPGKTVSLGNTTNENLASYFTYTRIEDRMIGGYGALSFKNAKPWEMPPGTTEYRYIVQFSNATYLIGGYVGASGNAGLYIPTEEFDRIIRSITLEPAKIQTARITPVPEGAWKRYADAGHGLSLDYPGNWTILKSNQFFENGDLFGLSVKGGTQRGQTEMYDGAFFAVMNPVKSELDTGAWMKSRYEKNPPTDPDRPPKYEQVSFGGRRYEKVTVCGLGCFPYYHIKINGTIYGFLGFAVGPNESDYASVISKILSGISFAQ